MRPSRANSIDATPPWAGQFLIWPPFSISHSRIVLSLPPLAKVEPNPVTVTVPLTEALLAILIRLATVTLPASEMASDPSRAAPTNSSRGARVWAPLRRGFAPRISPDWTVRVWLVSVSVPELNVNVPLEVRVPVVSEPPSRVSVPSALTVVASRTGQSVPYPRRA